MTPDVITSVTLVKIAVTPTTCCYVPRAKYVATAAYLKSFQAIASRFPGEPDVFRFADIGCELGAFAVFAGLRWPYAYVDAFHDDDDAGDRKVIRLNAQAGSRFFDALPDPVPHVDALHVGHKVDPNSLRFEQDWMPAVRLCVWEFNKSSRLENSIGFMRYFGLSVQHVQTISPGRGWTLFFRKQR